jgi:magnesium-transporting ATPase (P-type)
MGKMQGEICGILAAELKNDLRKARVMGESTNLAIFNEWLLRRHRQALKEWANLIVARMSPGVKVQIVDGLTAPVGVSPAEASPEPDVVVEART